jgi:ubiquinone/menaquinone biosynthesis C-methylase UbiE
MPQRASVPWAIRLYRKSVLKQEKFRAIERFLPRLEGKTCLDIGGDNGVISFLLREKGGTWHSADMAETIESIRKVVKQNVHPLYGSHLPYPDEYFDLVVVIDYLEHIPDDRAFVGELSRVLKRHGELIVNVPHAKRRAILRPIRLAFGLTDQRHGHVRPGYREKELQQLLNGLFTVRQTTTYSRFFSQAIDIIFAFVHTHLGEREGKETAKGLIITQEDFGWDTAAVLLSSALYPVCWLLFQLNRLLFLTKGYLLMLRAEKKSPRRL